MCIAFPSHPALLSLCTQTAAALTGLCVVLGLAIDGVEREAGLPGDVEPGDGQRVHLLQGGRLVGALLQPLQTLGDVERQVDQGPVRLTLVECGREVITVLDMEHRVYFNTTYSLLYKLELGSQVRS